MSERKVKVIKKEEIDRKLKREQRAEITLLEVLIERYPDRARKFVQKISTKSEFANVLY
jgi:hypothetical protein